MPDTQLREDLLKLAVNFLSLPKVQTATKEKKITFLKSKGLTEAEITEAFKRTEQQNNNTSTTPESTTASSSSSSSTSATTPEATTTTPPSSTFASSSSSIPSLKYIPPPTALIPEKPLEPLIIYQPVPEPEKVPTSKVLAMSIILGIGMTGVASSLISIVKRLLLPVFSTYTGYKHNRYLHCIPEVEKLHESINKTIKEEKDQDELDALDKPGVYQLVDTQQLLADRLSKIVSDAQTLSSLKSYKKSSPSKHTPSSLRQSLNDLSETLLDLSNEDEPVIVKGMKGEIRTLKGMCLNRR
ncbi:unnamed protein product [Cunninghamella blakesleeana]